MFHNRVTLVTGAGSGIGRACAKALAERVASVVTDIRMEAAEETVSPITQAGGTAVALEQGASKVEDAETAVQYAVDTFGKLTYAVNNVALMSPKRRWAKWTFRNGNR